MDHNREDDEKSGQRNNVEEEIMRPRLTRWHYRIPCGPLATPSLLPGHKCDRPFNHHPQSFLTLRLYGVTQNVIAW